MECDGRAGVRFAPGLTLKCSPDGPSRGGSRLTARCQIWDVQEPRRLGKFLARARAPPVAALLGLGGRVG